MSYAPDPRSTNSPILFAPKKKLEAMKQKRDSRATKRIKIEVKAEIKAEPLSSGFGRGAVIDLT